MRSVARWAVILPLYVGLATACSQDDRLAETLGSDGLELRAEIDARELGTPPLPDSFSGTWSLMLGSDGYRIESDELTVGGTLRTRGDELIFIDQPAPKGTFNCYVNGERTFTEGEATYDFTYDGRTLVLSARDEPCPLRAEILERTWNPEGPGA